MGILVLLTGAIVLALVLYVLWPKKPPLSEIEAVPQATIAEAPEGARVRIVGKVVAHEETLRSPVSNGECVAWTLGLSELRHVPGGTMGAQSPIEVADYTGSVEFLVDDGSGMQALVRHKRVEAYLAVNERGGVSGHVVSIPLAAHDLIPEGVDRDQLRFDERLLVEGMEVTVVGKVRWEEAPQLGSEGEGYRTAVTAKRPVLKASPEGPLFITNLRAEDG